MALVMLIPTYILSQERSINPVMNSLKGTPIVVPIIGFFLRDRLGQSLFGDNTFLSTQSAPLQVAAGGLIEARFEFRMPILPMGDYSITVALAEGTQQDHVQHHWIHDALVFRSHSSSVRHGLIGLPMRSVTLDVAPLPGEPQDAHP